MVKIRDHQIFINGKPTFLYGAEFHYFRADVSVWEERLHQIRDAGFNLVSTYVPWIWHEYADGQWDFAGSTHERRNLKHFLDLCDKMGLYCIVRPGPYVMSELKNAGIPGWLVDDYPETVARDREGGWHPTRVVSYLHPKFLELAQRWYEKVCAVIAPHQIGQGGSVIMFQLDNEIGMLHWVSNTSDYSSHSIEHYAKFLGQRYQDVSQVREELSVPGQTFLEVAQQLVGSPPNPLAAHWLWIDYRRDYIVEYVKVLRTYALNFGISVPFIVNVHGFKDFSIYSRGTDYPIGLSQLRDVAKIEDVVIAGDFYPGHIGYDNFHDLILSSVLTEAISRPDQVLFSAEFQSGRLADRPRVYPQDVDLITRICVSQGMNALNYYMFAGGTNVGGIGLFGERHEWQAPIAASGQLRPSYETTAYLGRLYQTWGTELSGAHKMVDLTIGFYTPYYATETVDRTQPKVREVIQNLESHREHLHFDGVWRILAAANVSYDAVELSQGALRADQHPILWVATTPFMDEATQQNLVDYVRDGGHLIVGPDLPEYALDGVTKCTVLADAIGARSRGKRSGAVVSAFGMEQIFCGYHHDFSVPPDALPYILGEALDGQEAPVAGFGALLGEGQVTVVGVGFSHQYNYYQEVMRRLLDHLAIVPVLQEHGDPILLSLRQGERGDFVSVINTEDTPHSVRVMQKGRPLFNGDQVMVGPHTGKLLPMNVEIAPGIELVYSTVEVIARERQDDAIRLILSVDAHDVAHLRIQHDKAAWRLQTDSQLLADGGQDGVYHSTLTSHARELELTFLASVQTKNIKEKV